MIIKGKSRAGPTALAAHLGNAEKNERVTLLETKGTVAQDLRGALIEMDAYAAGTNCTKPLYHAAFSPQPPHRLTAAQQIETIEAFEEKFGLAGHARVVVMHEKLGREHLHVVWSRIDLDTMKAISDSHNYRKHEEVARDLERRFEHERVQGAHHERDGVERPSRTPSRAELRQEERTGIKGKNVAAEVTAAFRASDNAGAFHSALADKGYVLAQGDRRDFVIVDRAGGIHSLARRIDGIKAAQLRAFMAPIDRDALPTAEQARAIAEQRTWKRDAYTEAKQEAAYSRAEDYVSQTQAALKDHQRRQKKLDAASRGDSMWQRIERGEKSRSATEDRKASSSEKDAERIARILDDHDRDRRRERQETESRGGGRKKSEAKPIDAEMTEAQRQRMQRLLDAGNDGRPRTDRDTDNPDRQREAPGGGRSRSR